MPFVKCSVDGCSTRLQPVLKVDPRDRDTWLYPECDLCGRPACERHSSELGDRVVCDRCRPEAEARQPPAPLIDLGIGRLAGPR
jgi:hypothetical protein